MEGVDSVSLQEVEPAAAGAGRKILPSVWVSRRVVKLLVKARKSSLDWDEQARAKLLKEADRDGGDDFAAAAREFDLPAFFRQQKKAIEQLRSQAPTPAPVGWLAAGSGSHKGMRLFAFRSVLPPSSSRCCCCCPVISRIAASGPSWLRAARAGVGACACPGRLVLPPASGQAAGTSFISQFSILTS